MSLSVMVMDNEKNEKRKRKNKYHKYVIRIQLMLSSYNQQAIIIHVSPSMSDLRCFLANLPLLSLSNIVKFIRIWWGWGVECVVSKLES